MIIEKIKENARRFPDRVFMNTQFNNAEAERMLTWFELDDYSDKLAFYLEKTLETKKPVPVYGHKDPYMVVCFLACVKSGRAYCPLDTNMPVSRISAIIGEVDPEIMLTTETLKLDDERIVDQESIMDIISGTDRAISDEAYVRPDDVFYIIFTSGSTGVPKGVQITYQCLDNFILWAKDLVDTEANSGETIKFINQAPFSFDLSVMDLYLCLYFGGTLKSITHDIQLDMKALLGYLAASEANVWVSTPSFADVCLADPGFSEGLLPELRTFLFCGEVLTNKTVSKLHQRFPKADIINTYGPTESTCAVTSVKVTEEMNAEFSPLPVGVPREGTRIIIMLEDGSEAAEGEAGEIVIAGDTVGAGYWNNPEKNEKCFGVTTIDGRRARFYKTGDKGYMSEGMLHYSGRMDFQVKLHGYRIELEDIESNLIMIPGIEQAAVIPKYREGKVTSLTACVVMAEIPNDERSESKMIKQKLGETLPEYMIPKKIRFFERLPQTNNGKTDRKALGELI